MSRNQQSIQDMWHAAQEILNFTAGMSYELLEADRRIQAVVLYEIVILGEATNRLSLEFREKHATIP